MSTVEQATEIAVESSDGGRGVAFWLCRYLPAEVAGTAALVLAGIGVTFWTDAAVLIALAGLVGECLGFYAMLAVTIRLEHARTGARRGFFHSLRREFGPAEILDALLVRPLALILGVQLAGDPIIGLLAGKLAADVVFYTLAVRGSARSARLSDADA